jgi:phosphoserine phosphatase RsbU-like protein
MTAPEKLHLDYRVAFLRYSSRREEVALHEGYELGRRAVADGVSILDVAQVHHLVFHEVLRDARDEDLTHIVSAASQFFLEVLAPYDMAQRGFLRHGSRGA